MTSLLHPRAWGGGGASLQGQLLAAGPEAGEEETGRSSCRKDASEAQESRNSQGGRWLSREACSC